MRCFLMIHRLYRRVVEKIFGFCRDCNSEAPAMYECDRCYRRHISPECESDNCENCFYGFMLTCRCDCHEKKQPLESVAENQNG